MRFKQVDRKGTSSASLTTEASTAVQQGDVNSIWAQLTQPLLWSC